MRKSLGALDARYKRVLHVLLLGRQAFRQPVGEFQKRPAVSGAAGLFILAQPLIRGVVFHSESRAGSF